MLNIIFTIYVIAFLGYWGTQVPKIIPTILRWGLIIISFPILAPVVMVKSLPDYLKKDGKWYKYRYLVYFTLFMVVVDAILFSLPI